MKNKNVSFFLIKLLIMLITNVAMLAVYFVVGAVMGVVGINGLLGDTGSAAVKYGIVFLAFLIYTMMQVRRFKVNGEESFGYFLIKECAVYSAFCLPLFAVSLIMGVSGIPGWLTVFYAPHMLMYYVSGISIIGYGVPVIIYASVVTGVRLAVIAKSGSKPAEPAAETEQE